MLVSLDASVGHEDILRAIGAVLDARQAHAVIVSQVPAGLLVHAQMWSTTLDDDRALEPLEYVFTDPAVLEAQVEAVIRRGTGHRAGSIERALRVVGRLIDEQRLLRVTAAQGDVDGEWSIWHDGVRAGRAEVLTLTGDDLDGYHIAGLLDRGSINGLRR
jgi:hypothetical protein